MYKPIFAEAQAAVALALFLRAGQTPPATLVNAQTMDTTLGANIKSVYTKPFWVTTDNMADTIIKDGWLTRPRSARASRVLARRRASASALDESGHRAALLRESGPQPG